MTEYEKFLELKKRHVIESGFTISDSAINPMLFDFSKVLCYTGVIDDRNQVVDMWRKDLGLCCLQVDYGDF